jgi:uracil-DNA glycosylase
MGVSGWDQDWSRKGASFEPGQAPMQRRFKHVARFLGLSYGEVFATNLVFARSRRFKVLPRLEDQIEACLPVHEAMMDIVRPSRLWVMGNADSAGSAIKLHRDVEWRDAKHANWSIGHGTVDFCGRTLTFCHTPHLSLWDATAEDKQSLLEFAFGLE